MAIFGDAVKDVGATAAHELRETAKESIHTVDTETIPAAQAAAAAIVDRASTAVVAVVADMMNRLDGVEIPINVEVKFTLTGKIGPITVPPETLGAVDAETVTVKS